MPLYTDPERGHFLPVTFLVIEQLLHCGLPGDTAAAPAQPSGGHCTGGSRTNTLACCTAEEQCAQGGNVKWSLGQNRPCIRWCSQPGWVRPHPFQYHTVSTCYPLPKYGLSVSLPSCVQSQRVTPYRTVSACYPLPTYSLRLLLPSYIQSQRVAPFLHTVSVCHSLPTYSLNMLLPSYIQSQRYPLPTYSLSLLPPSYIQSQHVTPFLHSLKMLPPSYIVSLRYPLPTYSLNGYPLPTYSLNGYPLPT